MTLIEVARKLQGHADGLLFEAEGGFLTVNRLPNNPEARSYTARIHDYDVEGTSLDPIVAVQLALRDLTKFRAEALSHKTTGWIE